MANKKSNFITVIAYVLVLLMVLLQGAYAIYAYIDPTGFAAVRGTDLINSGDADWVKIYASRTLFIALIIGFLLYVKNYQALMWAALLGTVMPVTDALLAYQAQAANQVVLKHIVTVVYLLLSSWFLWLVVKRQKKSDGV